MTTYEVTYQTVNGTFSLPSWTLAEAQADVKRLKALVTQPGYAAWGIKLRKLTA